MLMLRNNELLQRIKYFGINSQLIKKNEVMKNILKLLFIVFLFGGFLLTSCKKQANLPGPDIGHGVTFTIHTAKGSDGSVNLFHMNDLHLMYTVDHLEGKYSSVDLMVSINSDFSKQYVVKKLTSSFPETVSVGLSDLISGVDVFTDSTDIVAGTQFTFYINVVGSNGVTYYGYDPRTQLITQSPAQKNIAGQTFDVNIVASYPYVPANFVGLFNVTETAVDGSVTTYQSNVSIDPDRPRDGLICTDIFWPGDAQFPSATKVIIDTNNFSVMGNDQIIWGGNAYGAYGRIAIENFTPGLINTAANSFWFSGDPTLPDSHYWWGGAYKWELTKVTVDGANSSSMVANTSLNTSHKPGKNLIRRKK